MNKKLDKGLDILFNTYWSSKGWRDGSITQVDFDYAKNKGYMFDYPTYESHDNTLKKMNNLLSKINITEVANAFLYSLSTRKLEYRSALGSLFFAKAIPKHKIDIGYGNCGDRHCYICGWYAWQKEPNQYAKNHGLNVFNFERYKFGGVRHTSLDYALFDLEQFLKLPKMVPSNEDKIILKRILDCVYKLEPKDKAGKLRDSILKEKIFKSNKDEISVILNIFGICGILASKEYPSYEEKFVDEYDRTPVEHKDDFSYPINRWHASDDINYDKFEEIFNYKIY